MHSANVMHRDLKPANILVDGDGSVRLADFGLAREEGGSHSDYVVTRWYRAPEVMMKEQYGMVIDIWSLGCVFAELLSTESGKRQVLFPSTISSTTTAGARDHINLILDITGHTPGENDAWITNAQAKLFLRAQKPRAPADLSARYPKASPEAISLLREMLSWDPNARPSARECFRAPYWGEFRWSDGEEDEPWPTFDGSFVQHCVSEEEARRLVNFDITRFHPEWAQVPGVEISTDCDGDIGLTAAAREGYTKTVRSLVGLEEVDVDEVDGDQRGNTALHEAEEEGRADVVPELIDAGADIEEKDSKGRTPLLRACLEGHLDTVKVLVQAGAELRVTGRNGDTCLITASRKGHTETVRYLVGLEQVDVDEVRGDQRGNTALYEAVSQNHADVVQVLIDAGADIEEEDSDGRTPLLRACMVGSLDAVRVLVKAGAKPRVRDRYGDTCLITASRAGHTEIVRYLVDLGQVDVDQVRTHRCGNTALHVAVAGARADVVQVLIDAGADIEKKDSMGYSPLLLGCCKSYANHVVKVLVRAGADVGARDRDGKTCLMVASAGGCTEIVKSLLCMAEVGLDLVDAEHWTVLHHAVASYELFKHHAVDKQHATVIQMLVDAGADVEAKSELVCSPLMMACRAGEVHIVRMLLEAGARLHIQGNGNIRFDAAARYPKSYAAKVQELIDSGARIEKWDDRGPSPLVCACMGVDRDIVNLLVEAGAELRVTEHIEELSQHFEAAAGDRKEHKTQKVTCLITAAEEGGTETVRYLMVGVEQEVDQAGGVVDADVADIQADVTNTAALSELSQMDSAAKKRLREKLEPIRAAWEHMATSLSAPEPPLVDDDAVTLRQVVSMQEEVQNELIQRFTDCTDSTEKELLHNKLLSMRATWEHMAESRQPAGAEQQPVDADVSRTDVTNPALKDSHFIRRALSELVTTADHTAPTRPFLAITAENHTALVNEVKDLQRNSPSWQELWIERCEKRSDGTCDPSHHDTGFLRLAIREIGHSTWKCQTQTEQRIQEIQLLCEARRKSQRAKAFPRADELRKMLWSMGVDVDDKENTWTSDDGLSGSFQDPEDAQEQDPTLRGVVNMQEEVQKELIQRFTDCTDSAEKELLRNKLLSMRATWEHMAESRQHAGAEQQPVDADVSRTDVTSTRDSNTLRGVVSMQEEVQNELIQRFTDCTDSAEKELLHNKLLSMRATWEHMAESRQHAGAEQQPVDVDVSRTGVTNRTGSNTLRGVVSMQEEGQKEIIQRFTDCSHSNTTLHEAVEEGRADVVQVLIDAGADIEKKDSDGHTPLLLACFAGCLDIVKMLIQAGADLRLARTNADTCLIIASHEGHTETVRYLVGLGQVDVDEVGGLYARTALHKAVDPNQADTAQVLIDAGADIEKKDSDGCTPLFFACFSGSLDSVKVLVQAGADLGVTDTNGDTCLTTASGGGHTETVRYLVGLGVDVNQEGRQHGETALQEAIYYNHANMVQVLIDAGADIEKKDALGRSPLLSGCTSDVDANDAVKVLVRAGADVGARDRDGMTCLMIASAGGFTTIVKSLLCMAEVGVDLVDAEHWTALHHAVAAAHADVVQVLTYAGADVEAKSELICSPLMMACRAGEVHIVRMLLEAGARLHIQGNGNIRFDAAARYPKSYAAKVQELIDSGARIEKWHDGGPSPLVCACMGVDRDIVNLLVQAGAELRVTEHIEELSQHFEATAGDRKNHKTQKVTCLITAAEEGGTETVRYLMVGVGQEVDQAGGVVDVDVADIQADVTNTAALSELSQMDSAAKKRLREKLEPIRAAWEHMATSLSAPEPPLVDDDAVTLRQVVSMQEEVQNELIQRFTDCTDSAEKELLRNTLLSMRATWEHMAESRQHAGAEQQPVDADVSRTDVTNRRGSNTLRGVVSMQEEVQKQLIQRFTDCTDSAEKELLRNTLLSMRATWEHMAESRQRAEAEQQPVDVDVSRSDVTNRTGSNTLRGVVSIQEEVQNELIQRFTDCTDSAEKELLRNKLLSMRATWEHMAESRQRAEAEQQPVDADVSRTDVTNTRGNTLHDVADLQK